MKHALLTSTLALVLLATPLLAPAAPALADATPSPRATSQTPTGDVSSSDAAAQAGRVGFGVVPATAEEIDERAFFSYGLPPGAVAYDHVAVVNYSEQPLTLGVYATDALNTTDGGFSLLPSSEAPGDLGAWITVEGPSPDVEVPGRRGDGSPGRLILPVKIAVPKDATPGDHGAGIVAVLTTLGRNPQGQNIQLEQRVAARAYVKVDGPLQPALEVTQLAARFIDGTWPWQPGTVEVTYTVTNTGNVRMGFDPSVRVAGPLGAAPRTRQLDLVAELLPHNSQTLRTTVTEVWPLGRLGVELTADPVAAAAAQAPELGQVSGAVWIWALTWPLALLVVLVLGLLVALTLRVRRLRRGSRALTPPAIPERADTPAVGSPA